MLLSNYTFSVDFSHALLFELSLRNECLDFLKKETNIIAVKYYKLLTELDNGTQNLSVQLFFDDNESYVLFEKEKKSQFLSLLEKRFTGKFAYFQSLLEEI